jgi:hypothetical protein
MNVAPEVVISQTEMWLRPPTSVSAPHAPRRSTESGDHTSALACRS